MLATAVRLASRQKGVHHPHCPPDEAKALGCTLVRILHDYKELTEEEVWAHAKGQGIRSRTHMMLLLKWLQQENVIDPSDSRIFRIRLDNFRSPANNLLLAELSLENIRVRDTQTLSMSETQIKGRDYELRPRLNRRLTFWDL